MNALINCGVTRSKNGLNGQKLNMFKRGAVTQSIFTLLQMANIGRKEFSN
jgi:hypothetical protein